MEGAACKGKLVERWAISAHAFGISGEYLVACLLGPTKAEWVLITGAGCYDSRGIDYSRGPEQKCWDKKLSVFNELFHGPDRERMSQDGHRNTMKLAKFGFGKSCVVRIQRYTVLSEKADEKPASGEHKAWSCANIRIVDKVRWLEKDEELENIKYEELVTTGSEPFESASSEEDVATAEFALPRNMYTYAPD